MKSFTTPLSSLGIALLLIQPLAALQASARSESSRAAHTRHPGVCHLSIELC